MYLDEEESRYYMPLKEYLAYCESLRLEYRYNVWTRVGRVLD